VHKVLQNYIGYYFKLLPATAFVAQFLPGILTFYSNILKSVSCVTLVHKAAGYVKIRIFKSFGVKK
jgi:hypothetical protein